MKLEEMLQTADPHPLIICQKADRDAVEQILESGGLRCVLTDCADLEESVITVWPELSAYSDVSDIGKAMSQDRTIAAADFIASNS